MTLVDGEGKPIPPDSWGGDLDPQRRTTCSDCGTPIPFGKFCPGCLSKAREANAKIMRERQIAQGIDPDAPPEAQQPQTAPPSQPPAHEMDMSVAMAQAQERAQAIVTPGTTVPPAQDHLRKSGVPHDNLHTIGLNAGLVNADDVPPAPSGGLILPAAAQDRVRLTRRSDEFLIGQAVGWLSELRAMAEDGKVRREAAAEILQLTAELTYALAGLLK